MNAYLSLNFNMEEIWIKDKSKLKEITNFGLKVMARTGSDCTSLIECLLDIKTKFYFTTLVIKLRNDE